MRRKVLIISSSPREGGNSDTLCNQFAKGAKSIGHTVEKIRLVEKNINFCNSCGECSGNDYSACPINDDMQEIYEKLIAADIIVLATPARFYTMCAQLKNFIDRCCGIQKRLVNKKFYLIMTTASEHKDAALRIYEEFRGFISSLEGAAVINYIVAGGVWLQDDILKTPYCKKAYEMAQLIN